jgi:hypothetical protein
MNWVAKLKRAGFVLTIALSCFAFAGAMPQSSAQKVANEDIAVTGYYVSTTPGHLEQTKPAAQPSAAKYGVAAYPLYPPDLAAGDGKQDVASYCNTCHSTRYITMQPPLPAAVWQAEVTKMDKTFGAQFPADVAPRIVKYLSEHYTPETRRR